jgi:hypothetical protein
MNNNLDALRANAKNAVDALSRGGTSVTVGGQPWNPWLVSFLTVVVILFCLVVLHYMWNMLKSGQSAGDVLRLATMPMVIGAAIFLVLLGFSNEQMTPVIGLLGTMIGYILGSATPRPPSTTPSPASTTAAPSTTPTPPAAEPANTSS